MKLLRDPLLHFLLIGAVIFGLFRLAGADENPAPGEIIVSAGQTASLKAIFSRTWQRQPTAKEMKALVEDYIRDEVLYREGIVMGLDRDDVVIRRRIRQKVEFVADLTADAEPTDAELKTFVADHPVWFRAEPRFSFSHVYFGSGPKAAELERNLGGLNAGSLDAAKAGKPFMAGFDFKDLARSQVVQTFGENFTAWIDRADAGVWKGPVTSAYGVHLVRVSERVETREPPFDEVREAARREWLHRRKLEANDAFYAKLRSRYVIKIEDAP
jgi:hypothetical protein